VVAVVVNNLQAEETTIEDPEARGLKANTIKVASSNPDQDSTKIEVLFSIGKTTTRDLILNMAHLTRWPSKFHLNKGPLNINSQLLNQEACLLLLFNSSPPRWDQVLNLPQIKHIAKRE